MRALESLANRVKSLNINDMIHELSENTEFMDYIIELNTRNQLYDKGVNANGIRLDSIGGEYSTNTIVGVPGRFQGKMELGLPTDRITLFNKGKFYESFITFFNGKDIVLSADTIKNNWDGAIDLLDRWGKEILGLNEDSLTLLRLKAKLILIPYIKKILLTR